MKTIKLTRGTFAKVDDADYEALAKYKWSAQINADGNAYAVRNVSVRDLISDRVVKQTLVYMHRQILGLDKGTRVVHEDHDGLNNQRDNLLVVKAWDGKGPPPRRNALPTALVRISGVEDGVYRVVDPNITWQTGARFAYMDEVNGKMSFQMVATFEGAKANWEEVKRKFAERGQKEISLSGPQPLRGEALQKIQPCACLSASHEPLCPNSALMPFVDPSEVGREDFSPLLAGNSNVFLPITQRSQKSSDKSSSTSVIPIVPSTTKRKLNPLYPVDREGYYAGKDLRFKGDRVYASCGCAESIHYDGWHDVKVRATDEEHIIEELL